MIGQDHITELDKLWGAFTSVRSNGGTQDIETCKGKLRFSLDAHKRVIVEVVPERSGYFNSYS